MTKILLTALSLLLSAQALAHPSPFAHPDTGAGLLHSLMHIGVLIPMGIGAFMLSRWLIRRKQG